MEHIGTYTEEIRAIVERAKARHDDPAWEERAAALRAQHAEDVKRQEATARKMRLHGSGVPMAYWAALEAPERTEALLAVEAWLAGPRECVFLVLSGTRGRGKSFAASWAVAERGGRILDAAALVAAGTFDPVWRDLASEPVVAIDELGAEYLNDAFAASLYALLNARFANLRRTVIATNLDAAQFAGRYCRGALERLRERIVTGGRWVSLTGPSMRRRWDEPGAGGEER